MSDALLHSCAVYFYAYNPQTRAYAQQSDSAVGCALLAGASETDATTPATPTASPFKLLFYNAQKQPLLQLAVTATAPTCTPQQDNYVNFLDTATQTFYSLRFKDPPGVTAFLSAVAFAKAQVLATTAVSASSSTAVLVDELALGKTDGSSSKSAGLAPGDTAGVALTVWTGSLTDGASDFFTANPLDIATQPATQRDSDLKRVRLIDSSATDASDGDSDDPLTHALATQALAGMHKHAKRLVTVVTAQQWMIASVELVKVKSANRASATAATAQSESQSQSQSQSVDGPAVSSSASASTAAANDELVQRMASLSRAGSKGSGLIASLSERRLAAAAAGDGENSRSASRQVSFTELQAAVAQTYVPVLLPGVHLPSDKQPSPSFVAGGSSSGAGGDDVDAVASASAPPPHTSLTAKVLASTSAMSPATAPLAIPASVSTMSTMSTEMARLMQEQSDLALLRQQLEESKRRLQDDNSDNTNTRKSSATTASTAAATETAATQRSASDFSAWQPRAASALSSSFSVPPPAPGGYGTSSASASRWEPAPSSTLEIVPSTFQSSPPSFMSSFQPTTATLPTPSFQSVASRSLVPAPAPLGSASGSFEVESGLLRLQRSSTSIESTLQDLQAKVDRLLNAQHGKSKYSAASGLSSSGLFSSSSSSTLSSASPSSASPSQSSALLLKSLEKALAQRDQLQTQSRELTDARDELAAALDEQSQQLESLQLENRSLLEKLQNSQQLQLDKFRLELRGVQSQLAHAQQQAVAYQDEAFRLRSELVAKDEQLARDQVARADDARQHRDALQRQLDAQVRQDARDARDAQVLELTTQWERERDALTTQLRAVQSALQDAEARAQNAENAQSAQLQQLARESQYQHEQLDASHAQNSELEQLLAETQHALAAVQQSRASSSTHELAALRELLKEFMNDLYFHFQDAFEDENEFTGREVVLAVRKLLKQNTMEVLARLEDFWQRSDAQAQRAAE